MTAVVEKAPKRRSSRIKRTSGEIAFSGLNLFFLLLISLIMIFPFYWVLCTSFADPTFLAKESILLLPKGIQFEGYKYVFNNPRVWLSYWNTIKYTGVGTLITLGIVTLTSYVLSVRTYSARKVLGVYFSITLFLDGGLIPTYLNIVNLGLLDTIWAITLPAATSLWYVMIMRTGFSSIPIELREAALVDGANEPRIFWQIMLPLCKASIATIALFAAVGYWNNLFKPLLYLNDNDKMPLSIYLRNLLVAGTEDPMTMVRSMALDNWEEYYASGAALGIKVNIRMASVIVTILPIMCVYPFVQRYFVKGVMLGSVKG